MGRQDLTVKESLVPAYSVEVLTANGTTAKTFTDTPRAVMVLAAWTSADNLKVKFDADTTYTTISSAYVKNAFQEGAVLPLAIKEFVSSSTNESNFTLMALY